jgi:hypothetical protein
LDRLSPERAAHIKEHVNSFCTGATLVAAVWLFGANWDVVVEGFTHPRTWVAGVIALAYGLLVRP